MGEDIFGSADRFNQWMDSNIVAVGGAKPREFLDSTFGITMLQQELIRIEHGVLA